MGPERQVLVRTPHGDRLRQVLAADGVEVRQRRRQGPTSSRRSTQPVQGPAPMRIHVEEKFSRVRAPR
jgi:hypothetical protein